MAKFCSECGFKFASGSVKFCPECGHALAAAGTKEAPVPAKNLKMSYEDWFEINSRPLIEYGLFHIDERRPIPGAIRLIGYIGIETGDVSVSTIYRSACRSCKFDESKKACSKCGRSSSNYSQIRSGIGDGNYLLHGWVPDSSRPNTFERLLLSLDTKFDLGNARGFENLSSVPVVPVLMGSLLEKDFNEERRMVFFADKEASIDSSYYMASAELTKGDYSVIAWIGKLSHGGLGPLAITVWPDKYLAKMHLSIGMMKDRPKKFDALATDREIEFMSTGVDGAEIGRVNATYYSPQEWFIGGSWNSQWAYLTMGKKYLELNIENGAANGGASVLLGAADSLRLRGMQSAAFELIEMIEDRFPYMSTQDRSIIERMRSLPAGHYI